MILLLNINKKVTQVKLVKQKRKIKKNNELYNLTFYI